MTVGWKWSRGSARFKDDELAGLPPDLATLLGGGSIPNQFFHYFSTDGVVGDLSDAVGRNLVRFGFSLGKDYLAVDLDDLTVLQVRPKDLSVVSLVNSSLRVFIDFMRLCEERYPYYPANGKGDFEAFASAANGLRSEMLLIDAPALAPGSYWSDFLSDVANGDYGEPTDDETDEE